MAYLRIIVTKPGGESHVLLCDEDLAEDAISARRARGETVEVIDDARGRRYKDLRDLRQILPKLKIIAAREP